MKLRGYWLIDNKNPLRYQIYTWYATVFSKHLTSGYCARKKKPLMPVILQSYRHCSQINNHHFQFSNLWKLFPSVVAFYCILYALWMTSIAFFFLIWKNTRKKQMCTKKSAINLIPQILYRELYDRSCQICVFILVFKCCGAEHHMPE